MTREEIFEQLKATMVELFELDPDEVTLEAKLREELDLDSIDAIDMVARLHKITGRRLELSSLKSISTVADVVEVVHAHLEAGES